MDELEQVLFQVEDDTWFIRVAIRESKLVVLERKEDEDIELDYENAFLAFVNILNNKRPYEFMSENNLEAMTTFLRERRAKLN